jgi:hypothetical protein
MLEALGLAYVEVGVRNNLEPLGGYVNLLDLGRSGDGEGAGVSRYQVAADFVEHWIQRGTLPSSVGASKRVLTPISRIKITGVEENASPEDRRNAVIRELETIKEKYAKRHREYMMELDESVNVLSSPPLWISMAGMINSSLDQIINAINGIEINGHSNATKAVANDGDMHL